MPRALIIDDKEENLYYLRTLLQGHDYDVDVARHGAEALVVARRSPPDVAVSDLLMPVMDGYTLLRHWKGDDRLKRIPFVVYTATYTEAEDERLALDLGADAFILKPCEPAQFLERIREAQGGGAPAAHAAAAGGDEQTVLKHYNETLIRKLEQKMLQLEDANRALQDDILERMAAQESLQQSAREQRRLVEALETERGRLVAAQRIGKVGSWETDLATLAVTWSEQIHRIFETDPGGFQPTHQAFLGMVHPDDRQEVEAAFRDSLQQRVPRSLQHRLMLPGGKVKYVEEHWQSVFNEQGAAVRVIGTCQDLTDRRNSAAALAASEARYRSLFENMLEGYAYCRGIFEQEQLRDFIYLEVNAAFGKLTGLYDVAGRTICQLIPDVREANPELFEIYGRVALSGRPEKFETYMPALQSWLAITVYCPEPGHFVAVFENITERRETDARLRYLNRVYAMLSSINSLIVRVREHAELFQETCRIAVEVGGFRMAMICMVDRRSGQITPVAAVGKSDELVARILDILSSPERAATTMVARSIGGRETLVSNDSRNDTALIFRDEYAGAGVKSMTVMPLIVSGDAVGAIALYAAEPEFFHGEEMQLLHELTGDIAYAIDHIDKQDRLDYLAYYDELTGLASRSLFLERFAQAIRSSETTGHKLALFILNLERFKNINDAFGRAAGDELLRQVADWLKVKWGDDNLLARLDTDRFAMAMPGVRPNGNLARLVENTLSAFLEHLFVLDGNKLRIGAQIGIALYPDDGATAEELFRNAEAALKKAKKGGDKYLFHTRAMTATVAEQLDLENRLRHAIDNQEFVLHYQPKFDTAAGTIAGVEALIRWNDPQTGLVPPGRFIRVLEDTGLIYEVGRWALRQAIQDYLRWRAAGMLTVPIAVNVSAPQLRNPGFVAEVERNLKIDTAVAQGLELEITESMMMEDMKRSVSSLQAIRDMGVTVAIDDFGTGFSSLGYLSKLPVDTLKIDRLFISEIASGPEGLDLVSTIINLAHTLKLKVVAEGVETEEQSQLLKRLACDQVQGFHFCRPVPVEVLEADYLQPRRS